MLRLSAILRIIRYRIYLMRMAFVRFNHRFISIINGISTTLAVMAFIAAAVFGVCFIIYLGFDHTPQDLSRMFSIMRLVQGVFITNVLFNLIFNFRTTVRETRPVKWVVDIAVAITLLPWIYPHPLHPWIPALERLLYNNTFLFAVLGAYSIVILSFGVMRVIGKRTNPSIMLSCSFLVFILIGSFLLMLPKCTYGGINYVDALFVSTSAVCITGLSPIDISVHFTPFGILVLAILIQIGGLGVLTFTSFFALFFSGNASIYNQLMLKDMIYSKSMSSLVPTLLYILGFTVCVELMGAVFIWLSVHGTIGMTLPDEITFSLFHSLSAFCNAGFSTIPGGLSNPDLFYGNQSIYWIMSILIISGSIGFPILVNFKDVFFQHMRRLWCSLHYRSKGNKVVHIYDMNTKIVLVTYFLLFAVGVILFFVLEYNHSLAGMSLTKKITQSVFNSVTPRSAGFTSINPASFLNVTIIMVLFLMWVGGASQSTGGGIKVNTFAAIILNLRAIIRGNDRVTAFRRTIATWSIRRANAVVALSIISYLFYSMTLMALEPDLPARDLLFESCSALFTVGSSLGITSELSGASEILLCTAMFLGRVGIISLLAGLAGRRHSTLVHYPADNIIIN